MKQKIFIRLLFLLIGIQQLQAQDAIANSGGNATGSNGTVSYTVGQVAYTSQTGASGSVAQGVQQPFEIFTLTGTEFTGITLNAVAYPNPTSNYLNISITNFEIVDMSYQLVDLNGSVLKEGKIEQTETQLDMESYPIGTYIIALNSNNKPIKSFKIIKN